MDCTIRKGTEKDIPQALGLIKELAAYEKALEQVTVTEEDMVVDGFGPKPIYGFLVLEIEHHVIGIAIYYYRYSTWKGKCLHLEDLVITESQRGKGYGGQLFKATVQVAKDMNARLLTWQVLDWNQPAIKFYKKLEAHFDPEWINCKLTKNQMELI